MPQYSVTTGLPQLPAGQDEKNFGLVKPLYLALNSLAQGLSVQSGGVLFTQLELDGQNQLSTILTDGHRKLYAKAVGSALAFGKLVNLYLSGGKIAARYADATTLLLPAHGIVNNPLGIDSGDYGEILLIEGPCAGVAGSAFGSYYYLSTNGDVQPVAPTAPGTLVQGVGFGLGTAGFYLHISSLGGSGGGGGSVPVINDLTTGGTTSALSAQQGVVLKAITDGLTASKADAATLTAHIGAGGAAHANVVPAGAAGFMTGADKTKLDGVAVGATANSSDAFLLSRANHTGSQLATTISDFNAAVAANAAVTANTAKVSNANHTGDAGGSTILTLATVNATVGTFGSSSNVPVVTVNGKGLITSVTLAAIAGGSVSATATTITVPYGSRDYLATVVDALVTGTSKVMIALGMYSQTDSNLPSDVQFNVESVAVGSFTVRLSSVGRESIGGPFNFFYLLG